MAVEIQLGVKRKTAKKGVALVDAIYAKRVKLYNWHFSVGRYAGAHANRGRPIQLHRFILKLAGICVLPGQHVDHVDRNTLNNTLANLRVVSPSVNSADRKPNKNNTTGYRNVGFQKLATLRPYYGYVNKNRKFHYLGSFKTAEEAARKVNEAFAKFYPEIPAPNPTV